MPLGEIDLYILHSMEVETEYCSGRLRRYIGIYCSTLKVPYVSRKTISEITTNHESTGC